MASMEALYFSKAVKNNRASGLKSHFAVGGERRSMHYLYQVGHETNSMSEMAGL